jgi:putative ribosome biogenesis GTPase RsgA
LEINDLSDKQQKVIELFLQGKNLFISGGAGCGKSYLLNFLKRNYHLKYQKIQSILLIICMLEIL